MLNIYFWEIDNFVIKRDLKLKNPLKILGNFSILKTFLYLMFGKCNGFASKARGFCMHACMYF
jgi:hypothetical protein